MPPHLIANLVLGTCTALGTAALLGLTNHYVMADWRRLAGAHWTERARAFYRVRCANGVNFGLFVILAVLVGSCFTDDDFPWAALIGGFLGAMAATYPALHAAFPQWTVRSWLTSVVLALSFRTITFGLLLAGIYFMPENLGPITWLIVAGWLGFQCAVDWGLWLWALRLIGFLRPPSPRVAKLVAETSRWAGVPINAAWETSSVYCQVTTFATTRTIIVTELLIERLSDAEIEAVCVHALARIGESKTMTRRLRISALVSRLPLLFIVPAQAHFPGFGPVGLIAVYLGVHLGVLRLQGRLGSRADYVARATAPDPAVYAQALEKICEANATPAVLSRSTHSYLNLYDRMTAAGVVPDHPRPLPPRRFHWTTAALALVTVVTFTLILNFAG